MKGKDPMSIHSNFSIIYRHGRMMHDRAMREFGLSGQQMGYLRFVFENPGVSQEDIASFLMIDKGAVAKGIRDMTERGFLRREQNPEDKRAYCLYATDKARRICSEGKEESKRVEKMITAGIPADEMKVFSKTLAKITENISKMMEGDDNK